MPIKLTNPQDQVFTINHPDNAGPLSLESTDIQKKSTLVDDFPDTFFEPPCKATLDLDFANQRFEIYSKKNGFELKPLSDIVIQNRATPATSRDALGGVTEFAANENRFTFDGKTGEALGYLSEASRTNLFTYSEDFSNAAWVKENGTLTDEGDQGFKFASSTDNLRSIIVHPVELAANTACTMSVVAKASGNRYLGLSSGGSPLNSVGGSGADGVIIFDLLDGMVVLQGANYNPSIESTGDGYYECTITLKTGTVSGVISPYIVDSSENSFIRQGDGSGVLIKRAQMEIGNLKTSYIKTLATPVTRSEDSMTRTLNQEWNPNGITFEAEVGDVSGRFPTVFELRNNTGSKRIIAYKDTLTATKNTPITLLFVGVSSTPVVISSLSKIVFSMSRVDSKIYISGDQGEEISIENFVDELEKLYILTPVSSNDKTIGTIKRLRVYPRAFNSLTVALLARSKK